MAKSALDKLKSKTKSKPKLLVGKQKNLDVNKNGKLDKEDFKILRGDKMAKGGYMADGGMIYLISDDGYEVNISDSDFSKETKMFFKKSMTQQEVKKLGTSKYNSFIHHLSKKGYEKMAKGGETKQDKSFILVAKDITIKADNVKDFIKKLNDNDYTLMQVYNENDEEVKSKNPIFDFSWKIGLPRFKELIGPMKDGPNKFRYEDEWINERMSVEQGGYMANGEDWKVGDIIHFNDGEDWKVMKVKNLINKLVIKPYNQQAKEKNVSIEIDVDMDYVKKNAKKMAKGGETVKPTHYIDIEAYDLEDTGLKRKLKKYNIQLKVLKEDDSDSFFQSPAEVRLKGTKANIIKILKDEDGGWGLDDDDLQEFHADNIKPLKGKMEDGGYMADGGRISRNKFEFEESTNFKNELKNKFPNIKFKFIEQVGGSIDAKDGRMVTTWNFNQGGDVFVAFYERGEYAQGIKLGKAKTAEEAVTLAEKEIKDWNYIIEKGGYMAKGGEIKNQYENKNEQDIWESWTLDQKKHFLRDHKDEFAKENENVFQLSKLSYNELPRFVKRSLVDHIEEGQYAKGGTIAQENNEMLQSNMKEIRHHSDELKNIVTDSTEVEPWVIAKTERASTDLSDVTHYLDGEKEQSLKMPFEKGGYMADGGEVNEDFITLYNVSSIDYTRIIKWLGNNFTSGDYSAKKEGNNVIIETRKLTPSNIEYLKYYLKNSLNLLSNNEKTKEKYNLSFNYNPSNLKNEDAEKIVSEYTKEWKHNNNPDEVSFYVMGLNKENYISLLNKLKDEDVYNIDYYISFADGGELNKAKSLSNSIDNKLKQSMEQLRDLSKYYDANSRSFKSLIEAYTFLNKAAINITLGTYSEDLNKMEKGGYMAKGGKTKSYLSQLDKIAEDDFAEFGFCSCDTEAQEIILKKFLELNSSKKYGGYMADGGETNEREEYISKIESLRTKIDRVKNNVTKNLNISSIEKKSLQGIFDDILDELDDLSYEISMYTERNSMKRGGMTSKNMTPADKANKFLDAVRLADNDIKLKDITVEASPRGNWIVYEHGKVIMTVNHDMLDEETIRTYNLEHHN